MAAEGHHRVRLWLASAKHNLSDYFLLTEFHDGTDQLEQAKIHMCLIYINIFVIYDFFLILASLLIFKNCPEQIVQLLSSGLFYGSKTSIWLVSNAYIWWLFSSLTQSLHLSTDVIEVSSLTFE